MKIFLNNKVNLMAGAQQVILFHLFEILFMTAASRIKIIIIYDGRRRPLLFNLNALSVSL
jgi:hypothetical protein